MMPPFQAELSEPELPGSILIVDDTRENLRLLAGILAEQGYQVRPVTNGPRALAAARDDPPDLILLDIMMPGMDGYAVCEALKADAQTRDIPIIFISALNETFDKVRAFAAGGVDYITKPFQVEEVVARVRNHLTLYTVHRLLQAKNHHLEQEISERKRIEQRLQNELVIAREVQQSLLPPHAPTWPGLDVACYSLPAHEVGGDLYVYHAFRRATTDEPGTRPYALAVGDVSGKGMPAALLMSASMASFRSLVGQRLSPSDFLVQMDNAISEHTRLTRQNCAMVYLDITIPNPSEGQEKGVLAVANAGCIMPILKRTSGDIEWINVGGIPLGIGLGSKSGYQEARLELGPGDMVILTSDGVVEARNADGEMFGFKQLEHTARAGPHTSARDMLHYLRSTVEQFVGSTPLPDDMTIVIIQV